MMRRSVVFAALLLVCASLFTTSSAAKAVATCKLIPTVDFGVPLGIKGTVTFHIDDTSAITQVTVSARIEGQLGNGQYGMHVHQYGDLTDLNKAESAGAHFVGQGSDVHGCPPNARHEGDMGNWTAENNVISQDKVLNLLTLNSEFSIVGLSVVLHSSFDNCTGLSGFSGDRLAACVIGVSNVDNNLAQNDQYTYQSAVAVLQPTSACALGACKGTVYFSVVNGGVSVIANVHGLVSGTVHGFHIHQYGDLTNPDGSSVGAHWNPNGRNHELPPTGPRHVGDMGNIQSYDSSGIAYYNLTSSNIPDIYTLLGRAVVIHADRDHGSGAGCDQAGTSGIKLMVGIIGLANQATVPADIPAGVVIDNDFQNEACVLPPSPLPSPSSYPKYNGDGEDTGGLKAGLAIGWVLVGLLVLIVIPGMIAFWYFKLRPLHGGETYALM